MLSTTDSKDSGTGSSEDGERPAHRLELLHGSGSGGLQGRTESEWSESRADSGPDSPECLYDQREPRHPLHLQHPAYLHQSSRVLLRHSSPESTSPSGHHHVPPSTSAPSTGSGVVIAKPRIWSLADMASKDHHQDQPSPTVMSSLPYGHQGPPGGGKLVSPLASRLTPHHALHPAMHPGAQFARPDFYRNFYGPPHLSGDMSILETYRNLQGSLGLPPTSAPPNLLNSTSSMSATVKPFTLNGTGGGAGHQTVLLTTASSGVSPTSSSSSASSSEQSPHPGNNLAMAAELKSPGRL